MTGSAKQASAQPLDPMNKVTFHVLDPSASHHITIEQEWRGTPEYLARHFHSEGIMVESPNGDSTWYNPSSIARMTFKGIAEKPIKKQTLMSKTPPKPDPRDAFKNRHTRRVRYHYPI